jgi:hypothetical protein
VNQLNVCYLGEEIRGLEAEAGLGIDLMRLERVQCQLKHNIF